ncbi:MAG: pseudouridine synthase [Chloroflexota bacterium]
MPAEEMRLQRALAQAGIASRRAAEDLIREGRVSVNGQVVTELGTKVVPGEDEIAVDGQPVGPPEHLVYLALNKPSGYVSTSSDPEGRRTVLDLVPRDVRLFPVGRLDEYTEGLLLLTNDGEFAYRVTHPKHVMEKEYQALVWGRPSPLILDRLRHGVELDGRLTAPAIVVVLDDRGDDTLLRIVLHEGRNRQVRRMCEVVGHPVLRLRRVRVGAITLGDLPLGRYRYLTNSEIRSVGKEDDPSVSNRHRRAGGVG